MDFVLYSGMKNLILIGGAPGVGKTTTCQELIKLLPKNIYLEGDWLWYPTPFDFPKEAKEMFCKNLVYVLNNFLSLPNRENIIVPWLFHKEDVLQRLLSGLNLDNVNVKIFTLICSKHELTNRIQADVSPRGRAGDVDQHVRCQELCKEISSIQIDTTKLSAKEVADVIAKQVQN